MTVMYSARSPKSTILAQPYERHVAGVLSKSRLFASAAARFSGADGELLIQSVDAAAVYHDLGKLVEENQVVLNAERRRGSLPVNHVDAGTAYLLADENLSLLAGVAVSSHHRGLPNFTHESNRGDTAFRDDSDSIRQRMDAEVPALIQIHNALIKDTPLFNNNMPQGDLSVFLRVLLSCVVDGDHTDSAINDGDYPEFEPYHSLRPKERLARLDKHIATLQCDSSNDDERGRLRTEMYTSCRDANVCENIASCSSPVGSGKTTAIMAHLLSHAEKHKLRRIFVVLPFTNIITQSVKTYRKALVLPGENPEEIVAELHHRADFENEDTRYLTALWRAPIIVTTAVSFFETLASKETSALRRFHELPGSAIFLDEAHAALPAELLPLAWRWIKIFAREWSCYWVLASGSLNRFWDIREITTEKSTVPEIVDAPLRNTLNKYEKSRVTYKHDLTPKRIDEFLDWIRTFPGPRLIILNTVQSAAVLADYFSEKFGRGHVEHLSTALIPSDREKNLERIKTRLGSQDDTDWNLFATSCVEAGVDLSFRTGFRELSSLSSLLQTAGRIDRSGIFKDSQLWSFCLAENERLKSNPGIKNAATVLRGYLTEGVQIDPELTTNAIEKELRLYGFDALSKRILEKETIKDFPFVDENFRVIRSNTKLAVVDNTTAQRVIAGHFSWRDIQRNSVQIAEYKLEEMHVNPIAKDIYQWVFGYDSFIGYMRGILDVGVFSGEALIL